jgi:hypothetical protein
MPATARLAGLLAGVAVTALAAGCNPPLPPGAARPTAPASRSAPASASPSPSPTLPAVALARVAFLGTTFLAPAGWAHHQTVHGPADGFVDFTAPSGGYSVYLEVNNCAACIDQGLVDSGVANGVPDPDKVLSQQGAIAVHRLSATRTLFTNRLFGQGPLLDNLLVIIATQDTVTGYVLLQVGLPPGDAALTTRVLDSLTTPATLGMGS